MDDFSGNNRALAAFAAAQGAEKIGFHVTITGDGEVQFGLTVGGHSVPVYDSDAHNLTFVEVCKKYLGSDGFNAPDPNEGNT